MNEENRANGTGAAHCAIGPSTLPARAICPCHESAPGGEDAQSGTRSHKVVEANIRNHQSCVPSDPDETGVTESPEMIGENAADSYMPGTTENEIGRGTWGARTVERLRDETAPGAYIHTEAWAFYSTEPPMFGGERKIEPELVGKWGTVDAFWESADGETVFIADYKTYANGDSEKSYLPQGMMYAVLLESARRPCKQAVFFVVAGGDRTVARYDFTLDDAKRETVATIRRVTAIHSGVFATPDEARAKCGKPSVWCKTCAHAATCPAISRAVAIVEGGGILTKPLAVRMAIVPVLESFIKATKTEVKAALDAGERVFDAASGIEYGYTERRGRAKLADLRGLAEAVIGYGVKPGDFAAAVSVSKTAVDGLLKAADDANGRKVKTRDREAVYLQYFTEPGMERYIKRIS